METKVIIEEAVKRAKAGRGTSEDMAILHLVKQYQHLKMQLIDYRRIAAENQDEPVYKTTPWYMQ